MLEVQSTQTSELEGAMGVVVTGAGALLELQSSQTLEVVLVGATGEGVVVGCGLLEELQSTQRV